MDIEGVKSINKQDNFTEVYLNVIFDKDTAIRWELEESEVLVGYRNEGKPRLDYIELLNMGMSVHGFDFTDDQRQEILRYIEGLVH